MTDPYTFPRKYRSCLNCVHIDQHQASVGGLIVGGCRDRLTKFGVNPDAFKKTYCGQWNLQQLTDNDY